MTQACVAIMNQIENDFAGFHIENGVLYFIYKKDTELDLEAAKKVVEDRISLQRGTPYPVICDIRGLKNVDKTARDYLAREGSTLVKAVALIMDSPAYQFMANFYLKVSKPSVPTRMFSKMEEALAFVEKYK